MEKMFSSMMAGFTKGMSEEEKKKVMDFGERMAGMCSCTTRKEMPEEEKKALKEKMMACCGGAKEMMSAFFKKTGSQPEGAEKSEKA
jgi:hypothetical protein